MPGTFVDRLPLPTLKVYTAGSALLLSMAVYHAVGVTSAPGWRLNATAAAAGEPAAAAQAAAALPLETSNATANLTQQLADVVTYMLQEPLCMWAMINMCYCCVCVLFVCVLRASVGSLRAGEASRARDRAANYAFYKFVLVFGVLNVQFVDELLLWVSWFALLGGMHVLAQLAKERFEYLSSSVSSCGWAHVRLSVLCGGVAACAAGLVSAAARWGLAAGAGSGAGGGRDTVLLLGAECVLVWLAAAHVLAREALRVRGTDATQPVAYYTHLTFDGCTLLVELAHVLHMVMFSNLVLSMPSLVLLMQLRHLLHELQARVRRHRRLAALAGHMSRNYPMASRAEVSQHQDNCAICWEPMKEARKLPCKHLFHNSCLCQWVQQDASCPTCRRALLPGPGPAPAPGGPGPAGPGLAPGPGPGLAPGGPGPATQGPRLAPRGMLPLPLPLATHPNHLFHFDGSRYVSWLPSFSVEVSRVRAQHPQHPQPPQPPDPRLDDMAAQVSQLFPQYPAAVLAADLLRTRSPQRTADNILEGRLAPPPPAPAPAPAPPPAPAPAPAPAQHTQDVSADSVSAAVTLRRRTVSAPAPHAAAPAPAPHDTEDYTLSSPIGAGFSASAAERERLLERRKQQLVASARHRYRARTERHS